MSETRRKNNRVLVSGWITEEFEYDHKFLWEEFYKTKVQVVRTSGTGDCIPIKVSELILPDISKKSYKGKYVEVSGEIRSYNKMGEDGKRHLELYLFVLEFNEFTGKEKNEQDTNCVYFEGKICKQPVFRITPFGRRITDLMIAVGRGNYNKADYIPCVVWGQNAMYARELKVGDCIQLEGRFQSREYFKKFSPESQDGQKKVTYEVSGLRIKKVSDDF